MSNKSFMRMHMPLVLPAGLFLAAGHEGSGLCLGPATAELISRHVLSAAGNSLALDGSSLDTGSFKDLLPAARLKAAEAEGVLAATA